MTDTTYSDADAPPVDERPADEPQWDLVSEQAVLGGMLKDGTVVDDVMDVIVPTDFYLPKHELIARAIGALTGRNAPTDPVAVTEELRRTEQLSKAGGAAYLWQLTDVVPTALNASYYARSIHEMAIKRRLVEVSMRIRAMGNASEGDVDDLVDRARSELDTVVTGKRSKLHAVGETFSELIDQLEQKPTYMSSPWRSLDEVIGGLTPGGLYIVAARPGSGKSIVALQLAAHLAHTGTVAFSSLEMSEAELQTRLLAQYGPVHMTQLRNHTLNGDDKKRVGEAWLAVKDAPIFIDDTAGVTLSQIRAHARAVARRGKLAGVVVDYLQLVRGEGDSRQEVVADVAQGLKNLAKDLNVPVIAAAQLRRAGERTRGARKLPDLDDLRESGAIEQAGDVVLLLDRDKEKTPRELTVVVAKNRHGESKQFRLWWQAEFARVTDRKWSPLGLFDEGEV